MKAFRSKASKEDKKIAARFMVDEAPGYHNALAAVQPDELSSPALRNLQQVLEAYNATADAHLRINLQHCTFAEVVEEVHRQQGVYAEKGEGVLNAGRNGLRIAGDYASTISPWLELIPSSMGLSFLNAGLKIVLNIAKQNADNREKIFKAFHDIVHLIVDTTVRQDQFASVQILKNAAISLYTTLVGSLARLIYILHGDKSDPQFKDMWKRLSQKLIVPSHQGKAIDDILTAVGRSSKEFRAVLEVVNSQFLIETHTNTKGLVAQTTSIQETTTTIVSTVGNIATGMTGLQGQNTFTHAKIDELREELQALRADQYRRQQEAVNSQEAMMMFFMSDMPKWWGSRPVISRAVSDPGVHTFLSMIQLFQGLNVPPKSFIEDVDRTIQQIGRMDPSAQTQAQQLLSAPEFFKWIQASHAETLYVQGNFQMATARRISPLSALCGTLSLNLSKNTDFIVLLFVCGLHDASEDPIAGPSGLIRSLIAQLLLTGRDFNLDFINTRQFSESIHANDLPSLNHTFRQLIEQLPTNVTVVCIIDGLIRFESPAWLADLTDVVFTLNQIIYNPALHPIVKLLVTTPFANSQHVGNLIQAHRSVILRQTVVSGGYGIAERSIADRRDRLREYRMAMDRSGDSEGDSDDPFYGVDGESSDDCEPDDDDY
ncbi:hypothetical protein BJY01DRAFT_236498 [Aspergillus pseudoustus]|uniref:Fungal STAND N-terminal Goodbye domain-containing protein n=1 Tax=Aspergillus pseudoustus TaxID=1810923 RepID=A0ABR4JMA1_9EURO